MSTLAQLRRRILSRNITLQFLSLPIHTSTTKLLEDCALCDFGEDLIVRHAYDTIFSLNMFTLVRGPAD